MIEAGVLNLTLIRGCTFEEQTFTMEGLFGSGDPVDLSGMIPYSQVRAQSGDPIIIDLQPVISDPVNGVVTIPEIDQSITPNYVPGVYEWDLILDNPAEDDTQQILFGKFYIRSKISA